ncbi:MAG: NUDIX domain-containing protein [Proteobacteria bacterium]|nr:NUDIX domain-containing protein [Pseudomonadota bacterium]
MASRNVDLIDRTTVFQGYFRIDQYKLRHETFAGGMSEEIVREVFERGHAAAALPYDPARDEIVLLEQFRVGALAAGREPWLIEVVAGIIEDGETAEDVARRETLEEAGLDVTDLERATSILVSPGGTSETLELYCARVDTTDAGGVFGLDDEVEDIRAFVLPGSEVEGLLASGQVNNATAVIALQWFLLNRDRLQTLWNR